MQLEQLTNEERLKVYNTLLKGCQHLWRKNYLFGAVPPEKVKNAENLTRQGLIVFDTRKAYEEYVREKVKETIVPFVELGYRDPLFLAHLVSKVVREGKNKDLMVVSTYANALSSADGLPFSPGSKYKKPNLRIVSAAAVQMLDPRLVLRVRVLGMLKYEVDGILHFGSHFPNVLRTAIRKYIKYREKNLKILEGIRKAGLRKTYIKLYRLMRMSPSDDAARILKWRQKDREIVFERSPFDFEGLTTRQIAEKIRRERLPVLGVLGALEKITPSIAVVLLENAKGDEAVILRKVFEEQGIFDVPEVKSLYNEKVRTAKTALDRAEAVSKEASEEVKKILKKARSDTRKEEMKKTGVESVFMMIDISSSMSRAIEFAKEKGAIIAEMVPNPENFHWGCFNHQAHLLDKPDEFVADAFKAKLFGITAYGSTDVFALYPYARRAGAKVDVIVTDQGHNCGNLADKINKFHRDNPQLPKPECCVIVHCRGADFCNKVEEAYKRVGIPVAVLKPETITNSALVVEAVATAMRGPIAVIEQIMETPLLKLPDWYFVV